MSTDSELKEAAERLRSIVPDERMWDEPAAQWSDIDKDLWVCAFGFVRHILAQRADDGQVSLKGFLDRAPGHFQDWLRSVPVGNFIRDRQREAFQMQGRYDGAMSEECKALFVAEYKMLTDLLKWIE